MKSGAEKHHRWKTLPRMKSKSQKKGAVLVLGPEWLSGLGLPVKGSGNNPRKISKGNG